MAEFGFCRNCESSLLVRINWNGQGFLFPLNSSMGYSSLCEEVCCRYNFRRNETIPLKYSLLGCDVCFLDSEVDFQMLFSGAKIYKLNHVDISVSKENGNLSLTTIGSGHDSCSVVEDDFLGLPYRSEREKPFLSDEWCHYIEYVGQKFSGGVADFREKLKMYAVAIGFNYAVHMNDGVRVHAICENVGRDEGTEKCNWYIKGFESPCNGFFYINEMDLVHTCTCVIRRQKHSLLDSDVVSRFIESDIMYNLSMRPKEIMSKFKLIYGFDITYKVSLKAKEKAMNRLYGNDADSFNKLTWYKEAVLKTNPGSYFELEVDPSTSRFKRLFLAYGRCVNGFELSLPVLYVDGTFGKSVYKGQVLVATERNRNKGMFPLTICVCDSESEDNWYFFFWNIRNVLECQRRVIMFISDRGVGLLSVFDKVFPGNPHLYCYKHLTFNLAKRYAGRGNSVALDKIRTCFFKLAYSSSEKEYQFNLRLLREEGRVEIIDSFLSEISVEHWCHAFFKGCRYRIMANGIAESFNSWISVERLMPVYCLLEQTRVKQMEMNCKRRAKSLLWTTKLTPKMDGNLEIKMKKSCRFSVHNSSPGVYEVRSKFSYSVDLNAHTCSCFKWQINCFPCPHALAAIQKYPKGDVYKFVDYVFHADSFRKSYSFPIHPVSNVDESTSEATAGYIFPPTAKRPPARRRSKMMKSSGEYEKKPITCGRCHKKGNHNKLTCTEAID